jgi:hypothetical protein
LHQTQIATFAILQIYIDHEQRFISTEAARTYPDIFLFSIPPRSDSSNVGSRSMRIVFDRRQLASDLTREHKKPILGELECEV